MAESFLVIICYIQNLISYVFCLLIAVDRCKDIPSKADKMRFVGAEWGSLSPAERDLWNKQAVETEKLDIQNMTEERKKKQISKSKKSLLAEVLACQITLNV